MNVWKWTCLFLTVALAAASAFGVSLYFDRAPRALAADPAAVLAEAGAVTQAPPAPTAAPAPASDDDPERVVASVDGDEIRYREVDGYFRSILAANGEEEDALDEATLDERMRQALDNAIYARLIRHQAAALGLDALSEAEAARVRASAQVAYDGYVAEFSAYYAELGAEADAAKAQAEDYMTASGYPQEAFEQYYALGVLESRLRDHVAGEVDATDADIKAAYDERVAGEKALYDADPAAYCEVRLNGETPCYAPAGVRAVRHIMIVPDSLDEINDLRTQIEAAANDGARSALTARLDALLAPAQATLNEIAAKLASGADFEALLMEYGQDAAMTEGVTAEAGYWVCAGADYDGAFLDAALALEKPGDVSRPVLGDYGYSVIRYESDVPRGAAPYASVRDALAEELRQAARDEALRRAAAEWRAESKIVDYGV